MDSSELMRLKLTVSRLQALAVVNLETVMNLSTAMVNTPGLSDHAYKSAVKAFNSVQDQINILQEISSIGGTGNQ